MKRLTRLITGGLVYLAFAGLVLFSPHFALGQADDVAASGETEASASQQAEAKKTSKLKRLFRRLPPPGPDEPTTTWEWRPVITIPALKLTQSVRSGAVADVAVLTSVGGGLSYEELVRTRTNVGGVEVVKTTCPFSISPATFLFAGKTSDSSLDFSYAATAGFFDNKIMIGVGYDLGKIDDKRPSRFFLLLSVGINFN